MASRCRASPSPPTRRSASRSTWGFRHAGWITSRSAVRAEWWRCGARRARCRRAMPTSSRALAAIPTTSIRSASRSPTSASSRATRSIRTAPAARTPASRSSPRTTCGVHGATREDFGKLCVAQRANALKYPHALFKKPLTLEEYMAARPIAEPLHLFDCVMPCAGAEGFLSCGKNARSAFDCLMSRLKGTIERHNAFASDPVQMRAGWALDRDDLYGQAGVEPKDIDFVETYDDYPVISLMQLEDLGFCGKGEGTGFRAPAQLHPRRQLPAQYVRRPALGRPGGRRRRLSRHGGSDPPAHRRSGRALGQRRETGARERVRHDQLRPRPRLRSGNPSRKQAGAPKRKNPVLRTRLPTLPPAARSRVALGLTRRRARALRAAAVPRLRHRAVPAARGLPEMPFGELGLARATPPRASFLRRPSCITATTFSSASGCPGAWDSSSSIAGRPWWPTCMKQLRNECACERCSTARGRR